VLLARRLKLVVLVVLVVPVVPVVQAGVSPLGAAWVALHCSEEEVQAGGSLLEVA
jgi:hypothetical protein